LYTEAPKDAVLPPYKPEDSEPSLLIAPPLGGLRSQPPGEDRVVFALAHGLLNALRQSDGHRLWATRVGVDMTRLPVRLPAREGLPERVLVLSTDCNTLTARDVWNSHALWQHRLQAPCLSRPVLVGNKAYIPCVNGRIDEIETVEGKLLGWYDVDEP